MKRLVLESPFIKYAIIIFNSGKWWGNNPARKMQDDIDVVLIDKSGINFIICECKFKNEKMDKNVYETLVRRTRNISGKYKLQKYIFFSLGGYTEWFDTVTDSNVILFTLEDMY